MPYTPEEKRANDVAMFGFTEADVQKSWDMARDRGTTREMYCMSMLSDVQELIVRGELEAARKHINIVKWNLSEMERK